MLMPAPIVPEYFTLLPSEICRFVLGYLMHSGCASAAEALFCESAHLAELRAQYTSVYDLPFHITQVTLLDIVNDYLRVANGVAHHVLKLGVVFRLGSVSTALPHVLKSTTTTQPGLVRLAHIRPNRMPFGKSCLPPRIVNLEHLSRGFQLPSLAVRPHSYSNVSSASVAQCTSSIVGIQNNSTVINHTSSSSSSTSDPLLSTQLSRPVFRFIRRSPLTFYDSIASVDQKPTSLVDPPCSTTSVTTMSDFDGHSGLKTDAYPVTENEYISDAPCSSITTPYSSSDISCKPSDTPPRTCTPSSSPKCFTETDPSMIPSEEPVCTAPTSPTGQRVSSPPTSVSSVSFDIARHLPPPTEGFVIVPAPTGPVLSAPDNDRTPASSKRRRHPPRHITAVSVASDLKGPDSTEHDDVDLESFLSALLSNPEQVATHINAKIGGQTRSDYENFLRSEESNVVLSVDGPLGSQIAPSISVSHSPDVSSSFPGDCRMSPPLADNSLNSPKPSEYPDHLTGWLERCNLDSCIDHVLSQFDVASSELSNPDVKPEPTIQVAPPEDIPSLIIPSESSTPVGSSLTESTDSLTYTVLEAATNSIAKPAAKTSKTGSRRRVSSPLCLSQFANKVVDHVSPPVKRHRPTSSRRKPTTQAPSPSVLHTPDVKTPGHPMPDQLSELESLQQSLFSSESTLKFYEEFVDVQEAKSNLSTHSCGDQCSPSPTASVAAEPIGSLPHISQSIQPAHLQPLTLPTQPTVVPFVSALLPPASIRGWPSSISISQPVSVRASHPVYTAPVVAAATTASTSLQPVIHLSTAEGALPQTIILCPPNSTTPLRLINLQATNSVLQSFDKPMLIRLTANTSNPAISTGSELTTGHLPVTSQWADLSKIMVPLNVDLDSPNPYRNTLSTPAPFGSSNVENIPPLIVKSGSQGKVLNLASMDVDKILSKSLDAKR